MSQQDTNEPAVVWVKSQPIEDEVSPLFTTQRVPFVSPDSPSWAPHDKHTNFGLDDQPTTCPGCGSRTEEHNNDDGTQNHTCLRCGFRFVGDWDQWIDETNSESYQMSPIPQTVESLKDMLEDLVEDNPSDDVIVLAIVERVGRLQSDEEAQRVYEGINGVYREGAVMVDLIRTLFGQDALETFVEGIDVTMAETIKALP